MAERALALQAALNVDLQRQFGLARVALVLSRKALSLSMSALAPTVSEDYDARMRAGLAVLACTKALRAIMDLDGPAEAPGNVDG